MANGTIAVSQIDVLTTSGTGTLSIVPPATNTNRTITLPDQTATLATLTTPSFGTTIGVGGATASASGAGVTFPATQSASTDANTLDDYEEGTFTPTIIGTSSAGTATYSGQKGAYVKIGRAVYVQIDLTWTGHNGTGNMQISGLPFTASAASSVAYGWLNGLSSNIALTASNYLLGAEVTSSNTTAGFYQAPTGGGAVTAVALDAAASIEYAGWYQTAT